jgi:hypothetical protein
MKKHVISAILAIVLSSCQFVEKQPDKQQLLEKELQTINWNEVDEFPSVSDCDSLTDKDVRKQCFFDFLAQAITQRLAAETFASSLTAPDTIEVKVTVFPDSTLKFEPQFEKDAAMYDSKKVDSILHSRLADFPKVSPAIKRGMPVKCQFVLPVILQTE